MNDVIGLVFKKIGYIAPFILRYDATYPLDVFYHVLTLLVSEIRQSLVCGNSLIGKKTDHDITMLCVKYTGGEGND